MVQLLAPWYLGPLGHETIWLVEGQALEILRSLPVWVLAGKTSLRGGGRVRMRRQDRECDVTVRAGFLERLQRTVAERESLPTSRTGDF